MTSVRFRFEGERAIGFDAEGHSGYAESGFDIVCAAVTSAIRLVETTVNDLLGLSAPVTVREEDNRISFRLPDRLSDSDEYLCQNLIAGLMLYLTELRDEYPDHIEVMEG